MSKYITSLGMKLADSAPGFKFPYTFKVVHEKSVNAFALPGGPIYLLTELGARTSIASARTSKLT
jgi:predicted Zn-dependent protease